MCDYFRCAYVHKLFTTLLLVIYLMAHSWIILLHEMGGRHYIHTVFHAVVDWEISVYACQRKVISCAYVLPTCLCYLQSAKYACRWMVLRHRDLYHVVAYGIRFYMRLATESYLAHHVELDRGLGIKFLMVIDGTAPHSLVDLWPAVRCDRFNMI